LKYHRKDFQINATIYGYNLLYKGHPIGGVGTSTLSYTSHTIRNKTKKIQEYIRMGERAIERILQGCLGHYRASLETLSSVKKA